ncbi:MAG: hypothetical protein DWP98_10640 [Bacteroidetes bacterium]|nr:MAG: hypothetical protein DWP98_10640 [Bacteroidota bacterium]MBL1144932.1 hypothetical protein [Bacteroidota bacterium]MCB0803794.1 glycosyltransferase family 39 protein [Flavobacteriales bacterium]NOG57726.1 hypothetical protein [Bacteroidota bacterium]
MSQNLSLKHFPTSIFMIVILLVGALFLFSNSMFTYPSFVHAWTQSDRLALAMNFQENGFDFFHPATFNLLTKGGITQVDFPIHDYLVAVISSIFNSDLIFTFRLYNLIYSLIGLFFLYKIALQLGISGFRAIFATSFIFTLPFFVYYQNGFLPSAPSFANFLIGFYYLLCYKGNNRTRNLIRSALFLTLAALARSPFLIYLVAVFLFLLWEQLKNKKLAILQLIPFLLGIILFVAYFQYNAYLAKTYGSMFLVQFLAIESFTDFISIVKVALDRWSDQLMSPFHAVVLLFSLLMLLKGVYRNNSKFKDHYGLVSYFAISFFGVLLFFIVMGKQFVDHDYYYMDTFLPILVLLVLFCAQFVKIEQKWFTPISTVLILFFFYFFSYAKEIQEKRYTPVFDDKVDYAYRVYKSSINDLEKWGITKQDTLTILEANSTNIPFTLFKNKGYTCLNSSEDSVLKYLNKPSNYVLLIDSFFRMDAYRNFPGIINQLELVNSNQSISLYKKEIVSDGSSDFFKHLLFEASFDFETKIPTNNHFSGFENIQEKEGAKSLDITPESEYILTFHDTLRDLDFSKSIHILHVADYLQSDTSKIQIVCQYGDYYQAHFTENTITEKNKWVTKQYQWEIPISKLKESHEIKIYYWNQQKKSIAIDNFNLIIYQ